MTSMKNIKQGPMENLFQGLDEQSSLLSDEEVAAELVAMGVSVDDFLREANALIDLRLKAERTAWMRVADEKIGAMATIRSTITSWVERGEEEIRAAYQALVSGSQGQKAVAFRNKGNLSVADMARILDDFERLRTCADTQAHPDSDRK